MNRLNIIKKSFPWLVITILAVALWFNGCGASPEEKEIMVTVPAVSGSLPATQPKHSIVLPSPVGKTDTVFVPNPVNEKLLAENQQLKDSFAKVSATQKVEMYSDAIQINDFSYQQEDSYINLTVAGKVRGQILSMLPTYTIKERIVAAKVTVPQTKFRLLAGVEVGNNLQFNSFNFKADLFFQNASGNMLQVSYDTDQRIYVGYHFSIFKIRK
ncbi:hypothetical protein SAMN05216480_12311 [Pustulibacterium marinum]|uniref:Uncharacterized protein n=1 Tax=Pustulibacterium marinum TaxID=1224947 RepID=A0A1I7IVY0_9FLAO|nr:hypothetical protein [Pustulibacterium marinum]SFU77058.1 hypothetical protein SAMN05216480_12311 [Pustulibacterium marinum]